jgi:hypothetical protein
MRNRRFGSLALIAIALALTVAGCAPSGSADKSSRIESALQAVRNTDPNATEVSATEISRSEAKKLFVERLRLEESWPGFEDAWKSKSADGRVYFVQVRYKSGVPDDGIQIVPLGTVVAVYRTGSDSWDTAAFPYSY